MFHGILNRLAGLVLPMVALMQAAHADAIRLEEAVAQALRNNPDYLQLIDAVQRADLDLEQARSAFRTRIRSNLASESRLGSEFGSTYSLGLSRRLASGSRISTDFITSDFSSTTLSELRFRYTRPLFPDPGRSGRLQLRDAESKARHARRLQEVGRQELLAEVIRAFYEAYRAREALRVQMQIAELAARTLQAVRLRQQRGVADTLELAEASLEAGRAQNRVEELRDALESRYESMKLLIGKPIDAQVRFDLDLPLELPSQDAESLEALQARALAVRPEILAAREMREAALERMRRLARRAAPPIDVSLQYSLTGRGDNLAESLDLNDHRIGIGLTMNTDFELSESRTERERAALAYREAARRLQQLENRVRQEVREAFRKSARSLDRLGIAQRREALARSRFEAERIRHERGLTGTLELLRAQQEFAAARHAHLSERIDALLARLELDTLTGRLDERWKTRFAQ